MQDHLKDRIVRRLEALSDERGYQILDYVEFLESKYAERQAPDNLFTRLTEKVEDTMRMGKLPVDAIAGTVATAESGGTTTGGGITAGETLADLRSQRPSETCKG